MSNRLKNNIAFTLAEVLITIGIIGIVAALVIPAVKNAAFEREMVSKTKETYAILSNAVEKWQVEGNCVGNSAACPEISDGSAAAHNAEAVAKGIAKHLITTKVLYESASIGAPPQEWIPKESYYVNGVKVAPALGGGCNEDIYLAYNGGRSWSTNHLALANGAVVKISGIWWHYNILFDVNGPKKPNRMGKDQYVSTLYCDYSARKSLGPYYCANSGLAAYQGHCIENNAGFKCNPDDGKSPLAYVLNNGKLPNLKALGYPALP